MFYIIGFIIILAIIYGIYWILFGRRKYNNKMAKLEMRFNDILNNLQVGTKRKDVERMFIGFKREKSYNDCLVYTFMYEINNSVKEGKVIYLYFLTNRLTNYEVKDRTITTTRY